jgi:hypothetical protein
MNEVSRRRALCSAGGLAVAFAMKRGFSQAPVAAAPIVNVKALVFDVFGTVVDWRNGVARTRSEF